MPENKPPAPRSWVNARAECSLPQVFKELAHGVEKDVNDIKALAHSHARRGYQFGQASNAKFSVARFEDRFVLESYASIDFELIGEEIVVSSISRDDPVSKAEILRAGLTLNNDGQCRLLVNGQELEQWQVRRMALERLFFRGPI